MAKLRLRPSPAEAAERGRAERRELIRLLRVLRANPRNCMASIAGRLGMQAVEVASRLDEPSDITATSAGLSWHPAAPAARRAFLRRTVSAD